MNMIGTFILVAFGSIVIGVFFALLCAFVKKKNFFFGGAGGGGLVVRGRVREEGMVILLFFL